VDAFKIAVDECLLLGVRPTLELGFALAGGGPGIV
jgi:hypothetical protein